MFKILLIAALFLVNVEMRGPFGPPPHFRLGYRTGPYATVAEERAEERDVSEDDNLVEQKNLLNLQ